MKRKFKLLIFSLSSATLIGGIAPIISSCATINKNQLLYDDTNKEIAIRGYNFFGKSSNIFQAFSDLNVLKEEVINQNDIIKDQNNNNNNTNKPQLQVVDSYRLMMFKNKLNNFLEPWLVENNLTFNDIELDLTTLKLDGWKITFNVNAPSNPTLLKQISFTFNKVSKNQINNWISDNIYSYQASTFFKGYTLTEIQNLSNEQILDNVSLPNGSIIWNNTDINNGPITSSITTDKNGNSVLTILIFTPQKGIGKLLINQNNVDINFGTPSQNIINVFGDKPKNFWSNMANQYITPLSDLTFKNVDINNGVNSNLKSYDEADNTELLKTKILEYKNTSNVEINHQNYKLNFLTKIQLDLAFYLKRYFNDLQNSWEIPSLLTSNIFATNNLIINNNQNISGNLGLEIRNTSNVAKQINLPITNKMITVPANNAITIIINFNNSNLFPYLTIKDQISNTAYLSIGFDNLSIKTYLTDLNSKYIKNQSQFLSLNSLDHSSRIQTQVQNIFPYSYSLNTVVSNVGYGNNFLDGLDKISQSYATLNEEVLKETKLNNINNQYQTFLNIIKGIQGIFLKISNNPTIVNFLQSISGEMYDIVNAITGDSNISYIISDLFSNKTTSEYLYSNIQRIISLIQNNLGNSPQLDIILKMLQSINNANPTLDDMKDWVKSIIGLYPTLEKLLQGGVANFMPLIKQIMTSLSNDDPPIFSFLFSNLDYIFNFLKSQNTATAVINPLSKYLDTLVTFANSHKNAKSDDINFNPQKYNDIRVLDPFVYGMTQRATDTYGFFQMLADLINGISPNNSISSILTSISNIFTNNFYLNIDSANPDSLFIKDYSENTWSNKVSILGTITSYNQGSAKLVNIYTQLGKCIKAIFNVYLGSSTTTTDLFTMLANNISFTLNKNTFSFNQQNQTVTQSLNIRFNLKQDIKWDMLPICVLLDNSTLSLGSTIDTAIKLLLGDLKKGGLARLCPTDIVVKKDANFVNLDYSCVDSKLEPYILSNGNINWRYQATENLAIEASDIWNSSNSRYKSMSSKKQTAQYYGANFSKFANLLKGLINIPGGWTNYSSIITNLINPIKIDEYNPNISNQNCIVTQLQSTSELTKYLDSLIKDKDNNYFNWTTNTETQKQECIIRLPENFKTELAKYFDFNNLINKNNNFIDFDYGFSATHIKLINDSYSYTLTINFSLPITYVDNLGNYSLVSSLSFKI